MREGPILFSGPMVRAVLGGTKTQTRRAWREQPPAGVQVAYVPGETRSPYGQAGDRLWVRETFWAFGRWETRFSEKKGRDEWHFVDMTVDTGQDWLTGPPPNWIKPKRAGATPAWWKRPAIFMPRAASKVLLEITGVRVERLHAIWGNDADCIAEGIEEMPPHPCGTRRWLNYLPGHPQAWSPNLCIPGNSFSTLWRSINGDESWDANPWVWVVEFKRVQGGAA